MEVVASVCNRLMDIAIEEYGLLRNVKEEAKSLRSTVSLIKALLHDAGEKQAKDEGAAVHVWLGQLKQVLFDAEDIIDEVATDALLRRSNRDGSEPETCTRQIKVRNIVCFCFGCVERIPSDLGVAHQIKAIRLKLDGMYDQKNKLGLQTSVLRESRPAPRPPTSSLLLDESYISGRDDEREKMIQLLLRSEEVIEANVHKDSVQVLVIVGIGGVGKTTLAKLTFNDPRVKEHFQLMMWVCVSEDFDLKRITREIMEAALSFEERKELFEISNWDLHQRRFKNKIVDKRFLLVLDDMWEEDSSKWESLCEPLIYGAKGSKIIVTTRKQETLKMVKGTPFPLEVMSCEALWPVFRRYAFGNDEPSEKMQLETLGRQIVKKLKGLPLAAKVIGRLLNKSLDMNHWANVLKSDVFTLREYSCDILPVLKLSYDHLSMNLKQCFAYCSLFPKDSIFIEDELISMWMAQNFIQITRDLYAEQVGYESIKDLLHQSFFELKEDVDTFHVERSSNQFKMHDLIHDLAESISKDDCFRLGDDKRKQMSENVRHVSIATDSLDSSKWMEILNYENLRTLVFLHQNTFKLTPPLDDLFMKLKRLRMLGLRGCKIEKLPSSIGKLKHLRFVDLSKTLIRNLPDSMSDLHNLQVLKLEGCRLLGALPRNTSALVNLRHLELDTEIASWVPGLQKLTALQELIVNGSKVGELADMCMLKVLRIWGLEGVASEEEAVHARLEAKEHLELLELKGDQSSDNRPRQCSVSAEEVVDALKPVNLIRRLFVRSYEGARSPKWMGDLSWVSTSLLVKVELRDCSKWKVLPPLGQLPSLKFLTISGMSGVRRIGPEFFFSCCCEDEGGVKLAQGFPSLEELVFRNMPEWEEWEAPVVLLEQQQQQQQQQHPLFLPRLRTLDLSSCMKLRELPPLPPTLSTLRLHHVGLTRLPGWMERCCDDIGRDVVMPSTSSSSSPYLLSTLDIDYCPNITSLDDGLLQRPLRMLKELKIAGCVELASLPGGLFRHLQSLESLRVRCCSKLSWAPSAATEEDALPSSLKSVQLHRCGDATGWLLLLRGGGLQKLTSLTSLDVDVSASDMTLAGLGGALTTTSLTHLSIRGRDDDHVDGGRALSTCLQGLIITCNSLKSLSIHNCSAITTLPSSEAVLRRLRSLETLEIRDCGELRSLGAAAGLVSLKELIIKNCPKLLHLVEEGAAAAVMSSPSASSRPVILPSSTVVAKKIISLKTLRAWFSSPKQIATWLRQVSSLQELSIVYSPQLRSFGTGDDGTGDDDAGDDAGVGLSSGDDDTINGGDLDLDLEGALLDLAPSLRILHLADCYNLSSLPSNLRSLSCLEILGIKLCTKIQRLPSAGLPETLEKFVIWECPKLAQRCREEGCHEWTLLSRIPHVYIYD